MEERVFGHYRVVEELGRGGMGVVYKAFEESLNRSVAIKVLAEHLTEDEDFVKRFKREAQSAAGLSHPNVIQIFFIGDEQGVPYFVMEFVEGPSVKDVLKKEGAMASGVAARLARQAASGLAAAHDRGLIHRDIKPANLMVARGNQIKIADFGLALQPKDAATRLTATGMLMGTPGYLSPEQCGGASPDSRSDIYSLGMTLYEMLAGSGPFEGNSPLAIIRQILYEEPPPLDELDIGVSPQLNEIVAKMLAKAPSERYQSCREVMDALKVYIERIAPLEEASGLTVPVTMPALSGSAELPPLPELSSAASAVRAPTTLVPPGATQRVEDIPPSGAYGSPGRRRLLLVAILVLLLLAGAAGIALVAGPRLQSAWADFRGGRERLEEPLVEEAVAAQPERPVAGEVEEAPGPEPAVLAEHADTAPHSVTESPLASEAQLAATAGESSGQEAPGAPSSQSGVVDAGDPMPTRLRAEAAVAPTTRESRDRPPPLPALPRLMVLGTGEAALATAVEQALEEDLGRRGFEVVDERSMPEIDDLLKSGNGSVTHLAPYLAVNDVHVLVVAEAEFLGQRELRYLGRRSLGLSSELRIHSFLTAGQRALGQGWRERLEYTGLTAAKTADQALDAAGPELADAIRDGWALFREERGGPRF